MAIAAPVITEADNPNVEAHTGPRPHNPPSPPAGKPMNDADREAFAIWLHANTAIGRLAMGELLAMLDKAASAGFHFVKAD